MPSPNLRVTRRCLTEDLGLPDFDASSDARSYVAKHPVVAGFVEKRRLDPSAGEPVRDIGPHGLYKSLHLGRGRGLTTWDADNDVCWLVAYGGYHASGDHRDVYNDFEATAARGQLAPTVDDYESLFDITPAQLLETLRDLGPRLVSAARETPGYELVRPFNAADPSHPDAHAVIVIDLVVESDGDAEQGWLGLTLPSDCRWPPGGVLDIVTALLPQDIPAHEIQRTERVGSRPRKPEEVAFTWSRYA